MENFIRTSSIFSIRIELENNSLTEIEKKEINSVIEYITHDIYFDKRYNRVELVIDVKGKNIFQDGYSIVGMTNEIIVNKLLEIIEWIT